MRTPRRLFGRARIRSILGFVTAFVAGGALVIAAPGAVAGASSPKPSPTPHSSARVLHMGTYSASSYAGAAKNLPGGLTTALSRDVHLTGEQYLANSAAAVRGVQVVNSLKAAGVHVLGSEMKGTTLVVNVASSTDDAAVTATGATVVNGAPAVQNFSKDVFHTVDTSDTYGGEAYFYQQAGQKNGNGFRCSLGFNGYSVSTGSPQFATAGHCATTIHGNAYPIDLDAPTSAGGTGSVLESTPFGGMVAGEGKFGSDSDYGIVAENPKYFTPQAALYTWGNSTSGAPLSSAPLDITGSTGGIKNATLCKSGSTSGWTCGTISQVDSIQTVLDDNNVPHTVNAIVASTCLLPGDSGGGAVMGTEAAGIDSGSDNVSGACTDPVDSDGDPAVSVFYPMTSTVNSSLLGQQGSHWELAVNVTSTPTVSSPASGATVYSYMSMTGTLTDATSSSTVLLYLDGATVPKKYTASSGNWTIPLTGIAPGTHSYVIAGGSSWSPGPTVSGTFTIAEADRIGGADRYQVAVNLAQQEFPSGPIPALYIADGLNYPDGLGAAPAAVHLGGTLLLTPPSSLPSEVSAEVNELEPAQIFVAGGTGSVSNTVFNQLVALANGWGGTVTRDGGATRYQSSQTVAESSFPQGTHIDKIFIANGGNFPDALSESGAAASQGSPVILVPGTTSALDSTTLALLQSYTPNEIVIAGGTASVSTGIQNQLTALFPSVIRLGGADRYQVSHLINTTFFPTTANAYFANGGNFPDALGGGVIAAMNHAPLTVTPSTCMEPYDITALQGWGTTHVTLLGGVASQSVAVAEFKPCS